MCSLDRKHPQCLVGSPVGIQLKAMTVPSLNPLLTNSSSVRGPPALLLHLCLTGGWVHCCVEQCRPFTAVGGYVWVDYVLSEGGFSRPFSQAFGSYFFPPFLVQCSLNFREDGISVLFGAKQLTVTFSRYLVYL